MPADLKELASAIATYEGLISEVAIFEKTFPPITDKMNTLGMLHICVLIRVLNKYSL